MLELLILLSSDISPYRDTFDMIHRYTWSLYRPISRGVMGHFTGQRAWMSIEDIFNKQSGVIVGEYCNELISLQGDQKEYMDHVTVLYVCDGTTTHKCYCAHVLLIYVTQFAII